MCRSNNNTKERKLRSDIEKDFSSVLFLNHTSIYEKKQFKPENCKYLLINML
ncbi:hypothetical protein LCGC14_0148240 [marine sediment metagenome]|uniref:Uncharacterized protein n=1 Tax=marine sediment metagenome TaxID=412755 RepID=A0A0F9UZD2_9ZZZZ